jgi:hypothetical protein
MPSPGFTKTNLNNCAGTVTVEEGAREAVRVARPDRYVHALKTRNAPVVR